MDNSDIPRSKKNGKSKEKLKKKKAYRWAMTVFIMSFFITAVLSLLSGEMINSLPVWAAVILLVVFIMLGILFDIIGLAVATADMSPFNSMAAQKIRSGKKAVWLISNAEKVTSFCNDVVGDIAGVVSGATGAAIAALVFTGFPADQALIFTLMLTSFVAALTVGGKALGKQVAINKSNDIVKAVAFVISGFRR